MGCDGGTIPKRDELVKTKKKKEQKDKVSERVYKWKHCSVSQTPLKAPVVACELGRLYNKDEVITRLLNKTQVESNIAHIRGLKDIKELNLTANPSYDVKDEEQKGGESAEELKSAYICPVASLEMNGKHRFGFNWTCGCVLSFRALNEVKSDVCFKCGISFEKVNLITINPTANEMEALAVSMTERRALAKLAKKQSKRKAEVIDDNGASSSSAKEKSQKKPKLKQVAGSSSRAGTSVSGLASSILRDSEFSGVRSKEYSVAKNPNNSEVYKSIFDTHKSAANRVKAHWVTCNPQYY